MRAFAGICWGVRLRVRLVSDRRPTNTVQARRAWTRCASCPLQAPATIRILGPGTLSRRDGETAQGMSSWKHEGGSILRISEIDLIRTMIINA
jgi:hypothetical protein